MRASIRARVSHGTTTTAVLAWREHEDRREHASRLIEERLSNGYYPHAFPSRHLQPLHLYMRMVAARIEGGYSFNSLDCFHLCHAYSGETLWSGFEYLGRHGYTATRVINNIIRSRIARASHGTPTTEPLERTALRLYKRTGRPELNERYAQIRKRIARGNA